VILKCPHCGTNKVLSYLILNEPASLMQSNAQWHNHHKMELPLLFKLRRDFKARLPHSVRTWHLRSWGCSTSRRLPAPPRSGHVGAVCRCASLPEETSQTGGVQLGDLEAAVRPRFGWESRVNRHNKTKGVQWKRGGGDSLAEEWWTFSPLPSQIFSYALNAFHGILRFRPRPSERHVAVPSIKLRARLWQYNEYNWFHVTLFRKRGGGGSDRTLQWLTVASWGRSGITLLQYCRLACSIPEPTTNYAMALLRLCPLLLSTSIRLMDRGGLDRGICRLPTIHWLFCSCVLICVWSFLLVTWHLLFCPSWRGILLCCSPEGFFPCFSRCEVKGQGCLYVQIVKHWDKFQICENGLFK